jgi:hypothetical protein
VKMDHREIVCCVNCNHLPLDRDEWHGNGNEAYGSVRSREILRLPSAYRRCDLFVRSVVQRYKQVINVITECACLSRPGCPQSGEEFDRKKCAWRFEVPSLRFL